MSKQDINKAKVVLITGASSGIGKALAFEYARKGYAVAMGARNIEALHKVEAEIAPQAAAVLSVQTDVTIEEDCKQLVQTCINTFGHLDVLINNAGISMRAMFRDLDLEVMQRVMNVNFWGTVYCTKYALPHLLQTKGSVVGVISIAGYLGLPARTAYSASKFAVRGFLDTLRVEHLKEGLHVLVAAPGFTASNIRFTALTADGSQQGETPRQEDKMMSAQEVAHRIARAVDKRKAELILTFVEGKFSVFLKKWAPRLLDKLTYNHMAKEPDSPLK